MSYRTALVGTLLAVLRTGAAWPGTFLLPPEASVDAVMHPIHYDGNGGLIGVTYCIDESSQFALESKELIPAVRRALATWTARTPTTGNLNEPSPTVPPGEADAETVALHEIGHSLGLGDSNIYDLLDPFQKIFFRNATRTRQGPDQQFSFEFIGFDNHWGSRDDDRGDDLNLFWFRTDAASPNNPFDPSLPASVDSTTYSRNLAALPMGHTFAANATIPQANDPDLPFPDDTLAVMFVPYILGTDFRQLIGDDLSVLRIGEAGLNESAGDGDDYTTLVAFLSSAPCDVVISYESDVPADLLAITLNFVTTVGSDHFAVVSSSIRFDSTNTFYLGATPDLTVAKDDGVASVPPGGTISYLVTASNQGDETGYSIRLVETVPEGTAFNAFLSDPAWGCNGSAAGSSCVIELSDIPASGTSSFVFAVNVPSPSTVAEVINLATVETAEYDRDLTNNEALTATPVVPLDLVVDSGDDVDDGACDAAHCSLREAIMASNAAATLDTISFALPEPGPFVISPTSPLPPITSAVIDGLSQPGAAPVGGGASVLVELDGSGAGVGADGLVLVGTGVEVRGLSVYGFDGNGIVLSGATNSVLAGNSVGTDGAGASGLGNSGSGILVESGSSGAVVGGPNSPTDGCYGPCNVIAFNGGDGVRVAATAGSGNMIRGNSIYRNGGLGVDLGGDGFTDNDEDDADTGANDLQNWPLITGVMPGSSSVITGQFSGAPNASVTVELFANSEVNGDPAGNPQIPRVGEGQTYLGSTNLSTDSQGEAPFSVSLPIDLTGLAVTATATDDSAGSTSEFSFGFTDHITHAVVTGLRAVGSGRGTWVEWTTVSEVGSGAFVLYRMDRKTGDLTTLGTPILALEESPQGARYRVGDGGVQSGERATYLVAETFAHGGYAWYGPFDVEVGMEDARLSSLSEEPNLREVRTDATPKAGGYAGETRDTGILRLSGLDLGEGVGGASNAVKIAVTRRGLYRVRAADIASILGMSVGQTQSKIRQGKMLLEVGGVEIPWFGNATGSLLYFFGEPTSSPYAAENVYWLYAATGTVMPSASGGSPLPVPGGSFASTEVFETDVFAATNAEPDPDTELWFWKVVAPGGVQSFSLDLADLQPTGGQAELSMDFFSLAPSAGVDQLVQVRVNGAYQGDMSWEGSGHLSRSLSVSGSSLFEGANTIELTSVLLPGQTPGQVGLFVDSFSVEYPRFFEVVADALLARGDTNAVVTVSGFVQGDLEVLDVSDPLAPQRLTGVTIDGGAGNWRASFQPASPTADYWTASLTGGVLDPVRVWGNTPSDWQNPSGRGNYMVLTDADLEPAAQSLTAYRAGQGYETAVVLTEDVYDEFNYGVASPHAIREFVLYALQQWALPPEFIVLAGSGTFDYRDVTGTGTNLVPPLLIATGSGLFSSDGLVADVEGDGLAEAAVGRIPAVTNSAFQAYVDKLTAYEGQAAGSWLNDAVLLADDPDGASAFGADILDIETQLPVGYVGHPILLEQLGATATRQSLFNWFDSGMGILYYLGHGGLGQLAAEGLLTTADVPPLDGSPLLPVVIAPTCAIARFDIPGFISLAESLVLEPDGGAVAVWSASGLSQHGKAVLLGREVVDQTLDAYRTVPLGEAIRQGVAGYASRAKSADPVRVYNLLGDPAITRPF